MKVTLFDLLTATGFVSSIVGGVMAGWRSSLLGAGLGFCVGVLLGFGGVWVLRRMAARVAASNQTKIATFLLALVYAGMFAWIFLGLALADTATAAIVYRFHI